MNPESSAAKKFTPVEKTQIMEPPTFAEEDTTEDAPLVKEAPVEKVVRVPGGIRLEKKEAERQFQIGVSTEASPDHPDRNEDKHFHSAERGLVGVFDGMGGVPAGDYAASVAAQQLTKEIINLRLEKSKTPEEIRTAGIIKKVFDSPRDGVQRQDDVEFAMKSMLERMNTAVETLGKDPNVQQKGIEYYNKQLGMYNPHRPEHVKMLEKVLGGIGCTASLLKTWRDNKGKDHVTIGQVGDSRIYRLRDGKLDQLTRDDSHVQVLIEEGLIKDDQDIEQEIDKKDIIQLAQKRKELAPLVMRLIQSSNQKIKVGEFRNMILSGIGIGKMAKREFDIDFKPQVTTTDLEDGDELITVSDGVSDNLTNEEIQNIALQFKDQPSRIAEELQKASTLRGIQGKDHNVRAKKDDVTAIVSRFSRKT